MNDSLFNDIYSMQLHDRLELGNDYGGELFVLRVIDGWIYSWGGTSTFVPMPPRMIKKEALKFKESKINSDLAGFASRIVNLWNTNLDCNIKPTSTIKRYLKSRLVSGFDEAAITKGVMNRVEEVSSNPWFSKPENLSKKIDISFVIKDDFSLDKYINSTSSNILRRSYKPLKKESDNKELFSTD